MPNLLKEPKITHGIAREILERVYLSFLNESELRDHPFEWEARESIVGLMAHLPGPLERKEREQCQQGQIGREQEQEQGSAQAAQSGAQPSAQTM